MTEVKLYGETGFDSVNIPDGLSTLNECRLMRTYNTDLIQDNYLAYITVDSMNETDAKIIDYVTAKSHDGKKTCYTVEKYEFVSVGVCKFWLLIDAYNSIGGLNAASGNEIIYATANRMHVSTEEDNEVFFPLEEPFKPAEKLSIQYEDYNESMQKECYNILETTVIPPKSLNPVIPYGKVEETGVKDVLGNKIQSASEIERQYESSMTGNYAIATKDSTGATSTGIVFGGSVNNEFREMISTQLTIKEMFNDETSNTIHTGTRWWTDEDMNNTYTNTEGKTCKIGVLKDLISIGADGACVAYWSVPKNYIENLSHAKYDGSSETSAIGVSNITSSVVTNQALLHTPVTVHNNKTKYGQGMVVKVYCPASGEQLDKQLYEIVDVDVKPEDENMLCTYSITSDLRSGGCPIFAWKYKNQQEPKTIMNRHILGEYVKGSSWRQIPLSAQGINGERWQQEQLNNNKNSNWLGLGIGLGTLAISGIATAVTGGAALPVAAMAASALVTTGGFISNAYKQKQQEQLLAQQGQTATTVLNLQSSSYARDTGFNSFYAIYSFYSNTDYKAFDKFLTLYGYNVGNKVFTNEDLFNRPCFNYIRANDIEIKSDRASSEMLEKVKEQLKAGVRLWHEVPNDAAISGGNK